MKSLARYALLTLIVVVAALLVREYRLHSREKAREARAASPEGQVSAALDRAQRWIIEGNRWAAKTALDEAWEKAQLIENTAENNVGLIKLARQRAMIAKQLGLEQAQLEALQGGMERILKSSSSDETRRLDVADFASNLADTLPTAEQQAEILKQAIAFIDRDAALVPFSQATARVIRRLERKLALKEILEKHCDSAELQVKSMIKRGPASDEPVDVLEQCNAIRDLIEAFAKENCDHFLNDWSKTEIALAKSIPQGEARVADALMRYAELSFKNEQIEEAKSSEEEALALLRIAGQPFELVWALDRRGARLLAEGQFEAALSDYQEAVRAAQDLDESVTMWMRQSQCFFKLHRSKEALAAAQSAYETAIARQLDEMRGQAGWWYARLLGVSPGVQRDKAIEIVKQESALLGQSSGATAREMTEKLNRLLLQWSNP